MESICTGPASLDWGCVYAGDRNQVRLELMADGSPWALDGAVLTAQARLTAVAQEVALEATVVDADPARGMFDISWDGEAVRDLLAGEDRWQGVWDLQVLEQGQTLPVTVLRGAIEARMDVTRP